MVAVKLKNLTKDFKELFRLLIRPNLYHFRLSQLSSIEESTIPTFKEIFKNTNQLGADLTKSINPIILIKFFDILELRSTINIIRKEVVGLDCLLDEDLIEIKITKAKKENKGIFATTWVGNNSSNKVPKYILISYYLDFELNEITHLFIGYINLDECITKWKKGKSVKSQFANLMIKSEDANKMHIIVGHKEIEKTYTHFFLEELDN